MQFCFCVETIFLACGLPLVLAHGVFCLRKHCQTVGWCALVEMCSVLWKTLVTWTRSCIELLQLTCSCDSTLRDELLTQKLLQARLEGMSNAISTLAGLFSATIIAIMIRIAFGLDTDRSSPQLVCLLIGSSASICAAYIFVLTSRILELYYATIMVALSFFIWSSPVDTFFFGVFVSYVIILLLSVHFMNMRSVVFWNLVVLSTEIAYTLRHPIHNSQRNIVLYFIGFTAAIIFITAGFKRSTISRARQEICISNLKIESSASSSLLDLVCDVVVRLDSKLKISQESRAFKAMLMKTGGTATKGVPFTNFIVDDEERQNFEGQLLAAHTGSEGKVGTFRATLADSLRNRVRVEIFFVAVEIDVGVVHYLLGVRESNLAGLMEAPSFPPKKDSKTVTPSLRKGTPSSCERAEFKAPTTPPQSVASEHLQFPQLQLTSQKAQYISMLTCLASWNVNVDRTNCCSFHAYANVAKMVMEEFREAPCDASFPRLALEGAQCQLCGSIEAGESNLLCGLCESGNMEPYRFGPEPVTTMML
eukprot:TRINITY_DN3807_c0_g1_i1.p1 TRINITY_DN3807_c0_g1~~TRINITY_DN3807_c0_g1_i1.p1  ORF type:complete len:535 (+),score=43.08 TRINITY_DN3807_c0_g1_i1:54-1658(+)